MTELLPEDLKNRLPPLYGQEGCNDPLVHLKYFFPAGRWTWFVTEGEARGDDFLFYGFVIGMENEWGYFTLNQLRGIDVRGLRVERDLYFTPGRFRTVIALWHDERA